MDFTNSYQRFEELHKLQQEKNKLVKQQRLLELTTQLNKVNKMKETLKCDLKEIQACVENINKNVDKVEEIITEKRPYIPMQRVTAQCLKDIKEDIVEIFKNTQLIDKKVDLDELLLNENVNKLVQQTAVCQNNERNVYKYGSKLIDNITLIKRQANNTATIDKKQTSQLSESTLMYTFNANDVSASSPIAVNHK